MTSLKSNTISSENLKVDEIEKILTVFEQKSLHILLPNSNLLFFSFTITYSYLETNEEPPALDLKKINFKFTEWFVDFYEFKSKLATQGTGMKTLIVPDNLTKSAQVFGKEDVMGWLHLPLAEIFTYGDYVKSFYNLTALPFQTARKDIIPGTEPVRQNSAGANLSGEELKLVRQFLTGVCLFYYQNNSETLEENPTFDDFMSHPPCDYSRPHGWSKMNDYVSYAEVLQIVSSRVARDEEAKQNNTTAAAYTSQEVSILKSFNELHGLQFRGFGSMEEVKIPYNVYLICFEQLQNPETIQPYSVEICYYYVLQNDLPDENIWCKKASVSENAPSFRKYVCAPSLKWFSVYDLHKILLSWKLYHKLTQDDTLLDTPQIFSEFAEKFNMKLFKDSKLGVIANDRIVSYKQGVINYLSFFGEFINVTVQNLLHTGAIQQCYNICKINNMTSISNNQSLTQSVFVNKTSFSALLGILMRYFNKDFNNLHSKIVAWAQDPQSIPLPHYWFDDYNGVSPLQGVFHVWNLNFPVSEKLREAMEFFNDHTKDKIEIPAANESWIFRELIVECEEAFMRSNFAPLLKEKSVDTLDLRKIHAMLQGFFIKEITLVKFSHKVTKKVGITMELQKVEVISKIKKVIYVINIF